MSVARRALLALSQHRALAAWATRSSLVRRGVAQLMPGERMEDALDAADRLRRERISSILTHLGENLTTLHEADEVVAHYRGLLAAIEARRLDALVSVKPTQLGLDLDPTACEARLHDLASRAHAIGRPLWVDMEGSAYVEPTLALVLGIRRRGLPIGVAIQAYLYRARADVETLLDAGVAIRVVKGAYLEPPHVALSRKSDVDESYFTLASYALDRSARESGPVIHLATHDARLIERLARFVRDRSIPDSVYEYAMLYGIGAARQRQLVADGRRVRVLVSYGTHWFPWYMRRLAERPANVWFVVRSLVAP